MAPRKRCVGANDLRACARGRLLTERRLALTTAGMVVAVEATMPKIIYHILLSSILLVAGCVSTKKYDQALKSAADARTEAQRSAALQQQELAACRGETSERQRQLDDATAENANLRSELQRKGTDVDALLAEKGTLASALRESKARLEELRRAEARAAERAALYQDLALRLKKMVDAGDLSIALRDGRMVLQMPNDILFDTGRTEIKSQGRDAIRQLATVLATLEGRKFHVGGHTDNVPISNERFASNWELSVARGLEVVRLLIKEGVAPRNLTAEGYAEFDPIATNDSEDGRAKNRRTEIALQPNVDEFISVPELPAELAAAK